jgi:RNA polymerase sigma-70 factor (ECF subfamily)
MRVRRVKQESRYLFGEDTLDFNAHSYTVGEESLLHLALNGDQEALGRLLASYMPQLYRIALRVVGTPQEAEDALQDGLLRALCHLREFAGRSRFSTWVTSIVANAALMRLRRIRLERVTSIDQKLDREDQSLANRIPDSGPNPEEVYARQERLQILERGLQSLPAPCRDAVQLRDIQGMSTKEAANALGLPLGTLKSQLYRAHLKLVKEVGEVRPAHKAAQSTRRGSRANRHWSTIELTDAVTKPAA